MCQKEQNNRMFREMLRPAWERLRKHSQENIAVRSGALLSKEKSVFELKSFNQVIKISFSQSAIWPEISDWHKLVILHYLDFSDGTEVSAEMVPFGSLKDGLVRGTKFDHDTERALQILLTDKTPEQVKLACSSLGAEFVDEQADLCAVFSFLPCYPVWLKIWFADEEFETSGKFFVSKSADHYLTMEDTVAVGELLLSKLKEAFAEGEIQI